MPPPSLNHGTPHLCCMLAICHPDNHQYGFDPHDDSDYLTIADNDVYDNVNHGESALVS